MLFDRYFLNSTSGSHSPIFFWEKTTHSPGQTRLGMINKSQTQTLLLLLEKIEYNGFFLIFSYIALSAELDICERRRPSEMCKKL